MVEGCLEWQQKGLDPPKGVIGETDKYQEQMNVVGRFVGSCCKIGSAALETSAADIYAAFEVWFVETEGNKVPSQKWFGGQFRRLELFSDFKRDGKVWYAGLELNQEYAAKVAEKTSKKGGSDEPW
jgi:putative DNA primase/helicase